ncbi:Glutamate racemase [hydrothermal vent metagenome]|uniref:glutamate racemase n=1 Tax=hydrothermal vent metagenome TaxID=652676 RepID=A0A3B0Y7J1_9ZZZZ
MKNQAIGIFDSGVGGLSVGRSIRALLPSEDIIYIADSYHAPYGSKSEEFIFNRSSFIVDYLISQNVKIIVVACNTATVNVIYKLRNKYSLPFIGVEPGIKPAVEISKNATIGVLATEQTINSNGFKNLLNHFSGQANIETQACPGLVELVESQQLEGNEIKLLLTKYVEPMLDKGVDTFVMGCTHYAFLTDMLGEIIGSGTTIVNTYKAVANETLRRLTVNGLLRSSNSAGDAKFYSSDIQKNTEILFEKLWGQRVTVKKFVE